MGGRGGSSGMSGGGGLLKIIDSINQNPIPRVSSDVEKQALAFWKKLDWGVRKNAPIEDVPMSSVKTWQGYIRKDTLRDIASGSSSYQPSTDTPHGLRIGSQVILMDGNHRAAVAYLRGDKTIKIRVVDYKSKGKG